MPTGRSQNLGIEQVPEKKVSKIIRTARRLKGFPEQRLPMGVSIGRWGVSCLFGKDVATVGLMQVLLTP